MNSHLSGMVLASAGLLFAFLGFITLGSLSEGSTCWFVASLGRCWNPAVLANASYYLALAGSGFFTIGVWESGIGRARIVSEGAFLVLITASAMLGLGFLLGSLPNISVLAAQIQYFCGLVGGLLVIGGLAKLASNPSVRPSPSAL